MDTSSDTAGLDISINEIIASAIQTRDDNVIKCNCHSTCSTKKCPCRNRKMDCTAACTRGTKKLSCNNNKQVPTDSDDSDSQDDSESEEEENGATVPSRKRSRSDKASDDGGLSEQIRRLRLQDKTIKDFVNGLGVDELKKVCSDLLRRNPGAYSDYIAMESLTEDEDPNLTPTENPNDSDSEVNTSSPDGDSPDPTPPNSPNPAPRARQMPWCRCTRCRQMPTDIEKKCCKPRRGQQCVTTSGEFARLCLDPIVLEVAMRVNEDLLAEDQARNNAAYRHQAYRIYIYWQHGRLGPGNRRVIPSCVVWRIRIMWPEPTGIYKGFLPGIGHLED